MATTTKITNQLVNASSNRNGGSNFLLDYSPPSSNTTTMREKYLTNIATANVVNNSSYTYSSPQPSNDSGFDTSGTPSSFLNNPNNINVNTIVNNFSNLNVNNNNNHYSPNSATHQPHSLYKSENASSNGLNSIANQSSSSSSSENKCLRCNNQVYSLERIGPIKGNIYHKTCFKCLACDRQLDLKTYYTNQIDLNDRQIYCQSHAPKSGKGVFGADNLYIHNVLNAPKLDVMQKVDNKPKVSFNSTFFCFVF
jgi:hypothetical protein